MYGRPSSSNRPLRMLAGRDVSIAMRSVWERFVQLDQLLSGASCFGEYTASSVEAALRRSYFRRSRQEEVQCLVG
jgi:hypothetical protein